MPVSMLQGGSTYFLAYDQVGSLRLVTDGAGYAVKRIEYDAFGNVISDTNSPLVVPFGFAGGLHDLDVGLVRFGYRDYDPDTGRWTAKDPIDFDGGDTDLYGYVQNDPISFIDQNGMERYSISRPEQHPGGKKHIHWGPKNDNRGGGAINKDGSVRHGPEPPRKVKKLINKKHGWNVRTTPLLLIFDSQMKILDLPPNVAFDYSNMTQKDLEMYRSIYNDTEQENRPSNCQ